MLYQFNFIFQSLLFYLKFIFNILNMELLNVLFLIKKSLILMLFENNFNSYLEIKLCNISVDNNLNI